MLISAVQQSESAICMHICPPSWAPSHHLSPSHPSTSSQDTELSALCYTAAFRSLSILHMVVYICQSYSLNLSLHTPPPSLCVHMLVLYVCVSIPALKTSLLYHLSRFYTYVWNLIWSFKTDFPIEKITHWVVRSYYMSSV